MPTSRSGTVRAENFVIAPLLSAKRRAQSGGRTAIVSVFARLMGWVSAGIAAAILSPSSVTAHAQTNSLVDEGSRPVIGIGHNYIYGISETVSPASGTVDLKIDLPTPKGRGLSFPFALTYNSGAVHRFTSQVAGCGGLDGNCATSPWYTDRANEGSGWSDTLPYATASAWTVTVTAGNNGPSGGGGGNWYGCSIDSSYNFYDAAGASHPLGLAAIGVPLSVQGVGNPTSCTNLPAGSYGYMSSQSGGDDYVTAVASANCTGAAGESEECPSPSFTVTDLEGTKYFFPAYQISSNESVPTFSYNFYLYPSSMEDRNGNVIAFSGPYGRSAQYGLPIMDTAGRQIVSAANADGPIADQYPSGATSYTVGGLTYNVSYTTTTAQYTANSLAILRAPASEVSCHGAFTVSGEQLSVVKSITAPDGTSYQFKYDGTYGLVNEIDYPDGGWVKYVWKLSDTLSEWAPFTGAQGSYPNGQPIPFPNGCAFEYQTPVVATRSVGYSKGSAAAQTQTFTYNTVWNSVGQWTSKTTTVVTTDNVTGKKFTTVYTYGAAGPAPQVNEFGVISQIPVETSIQYFATTSTSGTPLKTVTKTWADQDQMSSETTQLAGGLTTQQVYCYQDSTDLVEEKDEYDYGVTGQILVPPPGATFVTITAACGSPTPTRKTTYGYELSTSPCVTVVYDSSGNRAAETDAYLDGGGDAMHKWNSGDRGSHRRSPSRNA